MKILLLDIETAPNLAYVWGLWKENIPLQRLISSGTILCWSAKWYGSSEMMFDSVYKSKTKTMLRRIHALMDQADAIIHYNGNRFDIPTLNREFLLYKLTPPSPAKQIDLLTTAKNRFRFVSNKMDFVAQQLGIGKKNSPSFETWVACMNKDRDAWLEMESYNKQDVELLEGIYNEFKPWIKNHPNVGLYDGDSGDGCPTCGSNRLVRRGYAFTSVGKYQRYRCSECGVWSRDRKCVASNVKRVIDK